MKKVSFLLTVLLLLNGCAESVALLGSSIGGASSGRIVQSTLNSAISYGVKHQTGKTPLGHVITYAEKNNPERKKRRHVFHLLKRQDQNFVRSLRNKYL